MMAKEKSLCEGCVFAKWNTTESGRLHPKGGGRCTYEVKPIPTPAAFYYIGGSPRPSVGSIERRRTSPFSRLIQECETFKAID